jgi:hypothetical protein
LELVGMLVRNLQGLQYMAGPQRGKIVSQKSFASRVWLWTAPYTVLDLNIRDGGHKQRISNGLMLKSAFSKRDKKQTMINLRRISTNWFKNQLCPFIMLSKATGSVKGDRVPFYVPETHIMDFIQRS